MRHIVLIIVMCIIACDSTPPIQPEQFDGGSGGASASSTDVSTASSTTTASGAGGATTASGAGAGTGGGTPGLSCDPCKDTDGTRLVRKANVTTSPDGLRNTSLSFLYDTQRNENCSAQTSTDGVLRCMPIGGATVGAYFSDAACAVKLAYGPKPGPTTCAAPPKYLIEYDFSADPCKVRTSFYESGGAYTGMVYSLSGTTCVQSSNQYNAFYVVGTQIQPDAFAPVTQTTETL